MRDGYEGLGPFVRQRQRHMPGTLYKQANSCGETWSDTTQASGSRKSDFLETPPNLIKR